MDASRRLGAETIPIFSEGIGLVLYRWSALRTAVENEWGGRESRRNADQLATDILSWFTQSKEPFYIDDLENILDEGMLSLNVEVEDGSIEEVADNLMVMHEECLEGNFRSIEGLREANLKQPAHVTKIMCDDEDNDDDEIDHEENVIGGDNSSSMKLDIPKSESNMNSVPVNGPMPMIAGEADDGWVVVSNRKNKGRKN